MIVTCTVILLYASWYRIQGMKDNIDILEIISDPFSFTGTIHQSADIIRNQLYAGSKHVSLAEIRRLHFVQSTCPF